MPLLECGCEQGLDFLGGYQLNLAVRPRASKKPLAGSTPAGTHIELKARKTIVYGVVLCMIIALLNILLYAIAVVIVLEIVWWILSFFELNPPPKLRKLIYAFFGVVILIALVSLLLGSGPTLPPLLHSH